MSDAVLVVGAGSFLAREFIGANPDLRIRAVGHLEADEPAHYEGIGCVVNFAFAPALAGGEYDARHDVDARAARRALEAGAHYVMISSRRVYAPASQWNAGESAGSPGADAYGRNKARIERSLAGLLGDRLTVLRPGNAVGYEPVPMRARFGAYLQNQLRERGAIRLTVSPETRRDLVPAAFLARVLRAAVERRLPGVFNVGAGRATTVGEAARWLIEGYGGGEVVHAAGGIEDEFLLDSGKLARAYGLACDPGAVRESLREAGRRLAAGAPPGPAERKGK